MERLWSPWRMEYIEAAREGTGGCFLCEKPALGDDAAAYIVGRTERAFAILNAYPYNPGHLIVAPLRHEAHLENLRDDELLDVAHLLQRCVRALREASSPDGFNLGLNLGRVAGAGLPEHVHWHVVPRWEGDTNFMPVVAETKVLPELLARTYERLRGRV